MNKWYSSAPCKGILLVLEHILVAAAVLSFVWMAGYPTENISGIMLEKPQDDYADSKTFEKELKSTMADIISMEGWTSEFETDGAYNPDKIVDIKTYRENGKISGQVENGIGYRLEELVNWYRDGVSYVTYETEDQAQNTGEKIIVCKKTDDTYTYYYESEFREKIRSGELAFSHMDIASSEYGMQNQEELLNGLVNSWISTGSEVFQDLKDEEGNQIFSSVWLYDGTRVEEKYSPQGAKDLLEIANQDSRWNGRLNEAMESLDYAVNSIPQNLLTWKTTMGTWSEGNTNLSYLFINESNGKVYTNCTEYQNSEHWEQYAKEVAKKDNCRYVIVTPTLADFSSNLETDAEEWKNLIEASSSAEDYILILSVDTSWPIQDRFYQQNRTYATYAPMVRTVMGVGMGSAVAAFCLFVWLTIISGHSKKKADGEIALVVIDRMKTEFFLAGAGLLIIGAGVLVEELFYMMFGDMYYDVQVTTSVSSTGYIYSNTSYTPQPDDLVLLGVGVVLLCAALQILWFGLVRRGKAGTLWKNSICYWIYKTCCSILSHMGIIWKSGIFLICFFLIHWIALAAIGSGLWMFMMLASEVAGFLLVMRDVIGRHRIKKGLEAIASGQVEYEIPVEQLHGEQREVAERINKIGDGLERAVQESVKNERMKTDLITNVSHDIKTPLTSIINYVDLLKRENFEDPRIQNYLKVLEEKSQRLKTLTEDVVEASKVSSGNIRLEKINLNLVELICQTAGEFEEKFQNRNLELKMNLPGEPAVIYADGRRMWRVLSNIFNNAAKYAMTNSRVYADLTVNAGKVIFTLKNVSEQPLNISADELTERFIRGDGSRSTEGSGLGLSIAKNLTELQGGRFTLYLDGDLFKAIISFPCVS